MSIQNLIKKAKNDYGEIYPCGDRVTLEDCVEDMHGVKWLWFNTKDHSTHVVREDKIDAT